MLNAMEELMRLHPGSYYGRREHRLSDFEVFEELERRHLRPRHECEADRRQPAWMIGEVAAAVAMLVVFVGILTVIGRLAGDASDTGQQPVVAVSNAAEPR
jgi:hypothetical protein